MAYEEIKILDKKTAEELDEIVIKEKEEQGIPDNLGAQVVAVFDISDSTDRLYKRGIMSALAERVLAVALGLDDNGVIPVYVFSTNAQRLPEDLTRANVDGYVERHIIPILGGSTNYSPAMLEVLRDIKAGDPVFIPFFTDGENQDHPEARHTLIEASRFPVFWNFFGVYEGRSEPPFDFLHQVDEMEGRFIDNAGFTPLGLHKTTTEELIRGMLHEFKDYPTLASNHGLLPWQEDNIPIRQMRSVIQYARLQGQQAQSVYTGSQPASQQKRHWWQNIFS